MICSVTICCILMIEMKLNDRYRRNIDPLIGGSSYLNNQIANVEVIENISIKIFLFTIAD